MKSLHHGALPEYISPYIQELIEKTGGPEGPIGRQFILQTPERDQPYAEYDPQEEANYEVAPGMLYKYRGQLSESGAVINYGRVLWTISRYCATYCRFCFRGRFVGLPARSTGVKHDLLSKKPFLTDDDLELGIEFIRSHSEINEVVLSGGDPMVVPERYLQRVVTELARLQQTNDLSIMRIHTRAPITNPRHIKDWHYNVLRQIRNPYVVLHINHAHEITLEVEKVVDQLRTCGAILLSQSVLLRGVNDSVEALHQLFVKLVDIGVRPYYLHQNDPVSWAEEFTVPIDKAIMLWQSLRPRLSGLAASAKFVIDTPHGKGKVVVPESRWNTNLTEYCDFSEQWHHV